MDAEIHYFCSKHYDYLDMPKNICKHSAFRYNKLNNSVLKALSYIWSYIVIAFWAIRKKPDLIHVQWLRLERFDTLMLGVIKKFSKSKIVYTAHNILPHNSGEKYAGVYKKFYNFLDGIIVHTQDTKDKIAEKFEISEDKIHVIPHGLLKLNVDEDEYERLLPEFKRKYNLDGKIVFTSLGEQSPYKGVDVISQVWSGTPELSTNSECRLLIVGKCKEIAFGNLASVENVVLDDRRISDEEFLFLLRHTDVYLLTYRTISQSGAMLTALTEKVPILVTDVGGLSEPLKIADIGWSIDELTEDKLREKLLEILDNREEIERIKNDVAEWQKIHQAYDWKSISRQTLGVYDGLI